jgi:hypothetical protein
LIVPVSLEKIGTGARGDRWRVLHDGIVIIESSRDPEHDAARALEALGLTGTIETRHVGSTVVSMRLDIVTAVRRTVIEGDRSGPRFGPWRPFDLTQRPGSAIADSASGQGLEFEDVPPRT